MKITTAEQANKLIAEALGLCWHDTNGPTNRDVTRTCSKCNKRIYYPYRGGPDWTSDEKAALELWQDSQRIVGVRLTDSGYWVVNVDVDGHRFDEDMQHNSFCHAICSAYLTSKGVEHSWEVPE